MLPFNYKLALYKRNNFGVPIVWYAYAAELDFIVIYYGIVGKKITKDGYRTTRNAQDEVNSKFKQKRKSGYKYLTELKDNNESPVEGTLYEYLDKYLPNNRTTSEGVVLPMLAKVYDEKVFARAPMYYGQYKINGLRCLISAEKSNDLFKPIRLRFQSREGTVWNSLYNLEEYLLEVINPDVLNDMIDYNICLDGELYLPGHSVNEINHFVKDINCLENKLIQFWCYDIAIENTNQHDRFQYLYEKEYATDFRNKDSHLDNKVRFILIPKYELVYEDQAIEYRDRFIDLGFEGLILRNPKAEYGFGERSVNNMFKYKKSTDGIFNVIDIYPEGIKRNDIPLILCKNDINDATFEIHIGGTIEYQKNILKLKEYYIPKKVYIEYGERSGVNQVPIHIKLTRFIQ